MAAPSSGPQLLPAGRLRTVIVIDRELPIGRAANAAAILAVSLGATDPNMPGPELTDADGGLHRGLFPDGLPILAAKAVELSRLREQAAGLAEILLIDFPAAGQTTTNYDEFRAMVAKTPPEQIRYAGVALRGSEQMVRALTKRFSLLR